MIDRNNKRVAESFASLFKDAYQQPELKGLSAELPENYFEIETAQKRQTVPYTFRQTTSDEYADEKINPYVDEFQDKSHSPSYTLTQTAYGEDVEVKIGPFGDDESNSHERISREKKHKKHQHKHHHKKYRHKESLTDELEKRKIKDTPVKKKKKKSKRDFSHREQLQESSEEYEYDDWDPKKTHTTDQSQVGYRAGRDPSLVATAGRGRDP